MLETQTDCEPAIIPPWSDPTLNMASPCFDMTPSPDSTSSHTMLTSSPVSMATPQTMITSSPIPTTSLHSMHTSSPDFSTAPHTMLTSFAPRAASNLRISLARPLKRALKLRGKQKRPCRCVVCGERASGMYFGAMVCLPCKSFFIRCTKDGQPQLTCLGDKTCSIDRTNRMRCQYCRYHKCLRAGMMRREKPEVVEPAEGQELCRVCADIANGIHFGVMTCEGCKKFFRRALKEAETYECKLQSRCTLNPRTRNVCRLCRYNKCLRVGMSRQAIRMGRPKKIKSEPSSFYDATYAFDQCSALFNNSLQMMPQPRMPSMLGAAMATMTPYGSPYCGELRYSPEHPRSPCGTDSGFESDGGSSGLHSPVGSLGSSPNSMVPSPLQNMPAAEYSPPQPRRQVPSNGMTTAANSCCNVNTVIKSEPVDVYECGSMFDQSQATNSYQSNMADCSAMFQNGATMCATEVKLGKQGDDHVTEPEVDLDDINDILCTLGQMFGNGTEEEKPKPETAAQQNQQYTMNNTSNTALCGTRQYSQDSFTQYNSHGMSTQQYPYGNTQYQSSAAQSYPQQPMQDCFPNQWSSRQQHMMSGCQSGYYAFNTMPTYQYSC